MLVKDSCILYFCETYFCLSLQLHLNISCSSNECEAGREESLDLCQDGSALASLSILPLFCMYGEGEKGGQCNRVL